MWCVWWFVCRCRCCLSLGFEARYVVDWTDHMWTEVFSDRQQRWLHCDPCEDVYDKPLLYEAGWGKKLTYCVAFSAEEVVDVTWRYTANPEDVRTRRTLCSEDWLQHVIKRLNGRQQSGVSAQRRSVLEQRALAEVVEFLSVKSAGSDVRGQGRTSGSLQWRLARGEVSTAGEGRGNQEVKPYLFEPQGEDLVALRLRVRYTCAGDGYFRQHADSVSKSDLPSLRGWQAGTFQAENIMRKVENDWMQAYLARTQGSTSASLSWTFEVFSFGVEVRHAVVCLEGTTFASGSVSWVVCGDNGASVRFPSSTSGRVDVPELEGSSMVIVTAELAGGDGDAAWQHSQLCRQSLDSVRSFPVEVDLHLRRTVQ